MVLQGSVQFLQHCQSVPSPLDLKIVGLHVELRQTLESVSKNCHLIERSLFQIFQDSSSQCWKAWWCVREIWWLRILTYAFLMHLAYACSVVINLYCSRDVLLFTNAVEWWGSGVSAGDYYLARWVMLLDKLLSCRPRETRKCTRTCLKAD